MYGKQFYVKKQTRPSKSDPGPQRTPILPTRELAGNPKFLHYVDRGCEDNVIFSWAM